MLLLFLLILRFILLRIHLLEEDKSRPTSR
jgi:hypothetical protein